MGRSVLGRASIAHLRRRRNVSDGKGVAAIVRVNG